jgi:hypothetical protein
MSKQDFISKWRPQLLLFVTEAWAVRREKPSDVGLVLDRHHVRLQEVLSEIFEDLQKSNGHANGHANGRLAMFDGPLEH